MLTRMVSISWPCDPPASASWVAEMTGARHWAQLSFVFLVNMGFCHIGRLFLNCWAQVFHPSQPLKVLGLQACVSHHTQLIFLFLLETGFHHVGQDGLDLLTCDLTTSASQSAGLIGMSHYTQPKNSNVIISRPCFIFNNFVLLWGYNPKSLICSSRTSMICFLPPFKFLLKQCFFREVFHELLDWFSFHYYNTYFSVIVLNKL